MRRHSFSKEIDRRRVDLLETDDNTIFLYEKDDGTTVKCIRPRGFSEQFSEGELDDLDTNGSYTDYVIYINDVPVTVESSYEKAQDTITDILVSIDDYGIEATREAVEPQDHVVRSKIDHGAD